MAETNDKLKLAISRGLFFYANKPPRTVDHVMYIPSLLKSYKPAHFQSFQLNSLGEIFSWTELATIFILKRKILSIQDYATALFVSDIGLLIKATNCWRSAHSIFGALFTESEIRSAPNRETFQDISISVNNVLNAQILTSFSFYLNELIY